MFLSVFKNDYSHCLDQLQSQTGLPDVDVL